jgi:predicted RNase H-like HicB family nuclease
LIVLSGAEGPPLFAACARLVEQELRMRREFTAVIEKRGRWYVGTVEEIPGVNTQGRTLSEVRRNLKEAVALILETNRSLAVRDYTPDAKRELITVRV